jgi:MFS family permease
VFLSVLILFGALILTRLRQLPTHEVKKIELKDIVELAKTGRVWFALPIIVTGFMLFGYVLSVLALQIEALGGLGSVGKATSFFYLIPIVFAVTFGRLSDKIGRRKILYTLTVLAIIGLLASLSESLVLIGIGIALIGLFFSGIPTAGLSMLADFYRHKNFETVSAFYQFCTNVGVSAAMLITIFVPYKISIYFAMALCVISIVSLKMFFSSHKELTHAS